jgi:hypothetical protein
MLRHQTEIPDARIPMPAALALMLMPSCGYYLANLCESNMCAAGNKTLQHPNKKVHMPSYCTDVQSSIHVSTKAFTLNTMEKESHMCTV